MRKFALISDYLPPSGAGQSLVIYRLLAGLDPKSYCLISTLDHREGASQRLPGPSHTLPAPFRINRGYRYGLHYLREGVNIPLAVRAHSRRITDIIGREKCEAVVACTGDVTLLPAGYLASRRAGVPFYAYIFDHYSYREWSDPAAAFWARRFEPLLMKRATGVIVPNEILRDDLRDRFGIEAVVIHNSFDVSHYETNGRRARALNGSPNEVKILYTGAIYDAHFDAFRNMVAAIESLGRPEVKLHLYTSNTTAQLEAEGIRGPIVHHGYAPPSDMPDIQRRADLLFLPLAFDSPYPELVRTSSTTKLGEYLATDTPVLVHAPADSFISWYFRTHECGVVVDESSPVKLAQELERALSDSELRGRLVAKAHERARADFSIESARATFVKLLKLDL